MRDGADLSRHEWLDDVFHQHSFTLDDPRMNSSAVMTTKKKGNAVPLEDVVKVDSKDDEAPHYDWEDKGKKKLKMQSEDFTVNLGKVIDTLNKDYQSNLFEQAPDFSIYTNNIEITDPTGKAFQGMETYKNLFSFLRWSNKTVFK